MRVLHVSDCYLPRLGGIETQVHALAGRQRRGGIEAEVVTATPRARHDRTAFELVDGVPVHRATVDLPFELPVHPRPGRAVEAVLAAAQDAGRPFEVAHLHTGVVSPFAYVALPTLVRAGMPVVVTVHSMWGPASGVLPLSDWLLGWSRAPMVVSAVSEAAAAPLRRVLAQQVRVIPNGIDVDVWWVDPLPRPADDVLLVAVQRLAPRKRCLPLLEVLAAVRARVPDAVRLRAVIAGDGPLRARMQRRLARPDLAGWVELVGRRRPPEIRELYRRADLFLVASTLESFGIAALEARTAGVPVLGLRGTGVGEFVDHGRHGLLAADDAGLVEATVALAGDPERRTAMAALSRAEPPSAGWPSVLRRCDEAYADARALVRTDR